MDILFAVPLLLLVELLNVEPFRTSYRPHQEWVALLVLSFPLSMHNSIYFPPRPAEEKNIKGEKIKIQLGANLKILNEVL